MVLPTAAATIAAATETDHLAWHEELRTTATFLGLAAKVITDQGHLGHHRALNSFASPSELPADPPQGSLGHIRAHQVIHTYVNGITLVNLTTASDVQAALTAGATGAVFGLAAGTYRITAALAPKQDQVLYGANGAVISGSVVLSSWTASGSDWWATRAAGALGSQADPGDGRCAITGCENPHDVFYDAAPLVRVATQGALATGKFFEDYAANRVYIRDDPAGHTVEQASARRLVAAAVSGVQVRNLVLQHAANKALEGAVEPTAAGATDWTVERCEIRYCHSAAVEVEAASPRFTVRHCWLHHNSWSGFGGNGDDCLYEDNEISYNNRDGLYFAGWGAGAGKQGDCARPVFRRNYVHHNKGMGIWCDINVGNALIEENYCSDNDTGGEFGQGIFYELSYGEVTSGDGLKTIIRNNTCVANAPGSSTGFFGGGQISVSASRDVEVYGNWVRGRDGIGCQAQLRTDSPDARGAHEVHNVHVHDNIVTTTGGGWAAMGGIDCLEASMEPQIWTSWGNTWENNAYHVASLSTNWRWEDASINFATWQSKGHDTPQGSADTSLPSIPSVPAMTVGPRGA